VDRHRFNVDLDPDLHFDADPDPDWHRNDADSHADLTPSFTHVGKSEIFFTWASPHWFIFLINVGD
jgi:hypothetical protein